MTQMLSVARSFRNESVSAFYSSTCCLHLYLLCSLITQGRGINAFENKLCGMPVLSFTAEADKAVVEPSAESAAPAPDSSEDKAKADDVESSPPAPVKEKTDDEGVVSNKTSVESLKETNENNSNNADFSQNRGWCINHLSHLKCH